MEVLRAVLAHIERWEPHLHATYALDASGTRLGAGRGIASALAEGRAARRARRRAGDDQENIATRGVPRAAGHRRHRAGAGRADAPPAARLRETGCVILCKTTMPDYGMLSSRPVELPCS